MNPDEAVDEAFFARKIAEADALRRDLLQLDTVTDAYRLILRGRWPVRSGRRPLRQHHGG